MSVLWQLWRIGDGVSPTQAASHLTTSSAFVDSGDGDSCTNERSCVFMIGNILFIVSILLLG